MESDFPKDPNWKPFGNLTWLEAETEKRKEEEYLEKRRELYEQRRERRSNGVAAHNDIARWFVLSYDSGTCCFKKLTTVFCSFSSIVNMPLNECAYSALSL